jgi:hypothetical protein
MEPLGLSPISSQELNKWIVLEFPLDLETQYSEFRNSTTTPLPENMHDITTG